MDDEATQELELGTWKPAALGLLGRRIGQRIRVTIQVPSREEGQTYEGILETVGPSDVSSVYVGFSFRQDDGEVRSFDLPLGHPIEVRVLPVSEPAPLDGDRAASLLEEAIRRFDADPEFHARAVLALRIARGTEFAELEGCVLTGAVCALVVADHTEELLP